ncbi:hypothetical protein [Lacrimispora sp.]|nr:hypothetical protein [Lacrimispora sp.]
MKTSWDLRLYLSSIDRAVHLVVPRRQEIFAAFNRCRSLRF